MTVVVEGEHEHREHDEAAAAAGAAALVPVEQAEHVAKEVVDALEDARDERELHEAAERAQSTAEQALQQVYAAAGHGHVELEGRLDGIESRLSEMVDKLATLHPVEAAEEGARAVEETGALAVEPVAEAAGAASPEHESEPEHHSRRPERRRGLRRGHRR